MRLTATLTPSDPAHTLAVFGARARCQACAVKRETGTPQSARTGQPVLPPATVSERIVRDASRFTPATVREAWEGESMFVSPDTGQSCEIGDAPIM